MSLLDWIFPKFCVGCGKIGGYFCKSCKDQILQKELICPVCKKMAVAGKTHPLCQSKYSLDGLWSLGSYQGSLRQAIGKLKYRFISDLVESLVELMLTYWMIFQPFFLDELKKDLGKGWWIVPVPLHPKRQKWRGFNQTEMIARSLAWKLELPLSNSLQRTINIQPQVGQDAWQRKKNIRGAFSLNPGCKLSTVNILLIDDVWTTGATLSECAKILKRAGAKKVWAITLAR